MDKLIESLVALQTQLGQAGIQSAAVGAIALSVWGEPRLTRDVDVKVMLQRQDAARLLEIIAADYVALLPDPLVSLRRTGILFVQDRWSTRLDLLLADTSFDMEAIRRSVPVELQPEATVQVCTAEDLIIYKLVSTRPRDHADAESVIHRQGNLLDDDYVLDWLRQFEIALDDSTLISGYRRLRAQWSR